MTRKYSNKLLILGLLIITGIVLQISGLIQPEEIIVMIRQFSTYWWLVIVLILLQTLLFTFALAGSTFLWIAATIYPPMSSTLILVTGTTLGGIAAYFFSRRLTDEWIKKIEHSTAYKLLRKENNFFSIFALRLMPAFPHSLINYSSGILKIRLRYFIPATLLGISIKSYIFSEVIYNATTSLSLNVLLDFSTYGPLLLFSLFILGGLYIKYKISHQQDD